MPSKPKNKFLEITIWYKTRGFTGRHANTFMRFRPSGQDKSVIKADVYKALKRIRSVDYYYVVLKFRRADGEKGYVTIVPKTLFLKVGERVQ